MIATAAIAHGNGEFTIDQLEIGNPGIGEVQVQIKSSGVCYNQRQLKFDKMVTGKYRLEELPKAFEDMLAGKNAKAVLVMDRFTHTRVRGG